MLRGASFLMSSSLAGRRTYTNQMRDQQCVRGWGRVGKRTIRFNRLVGESSSWSGAAWLMGPVLALWRLLVGGAWVWVTCTAGCEP